MARDVLVGLRRIGLTYTFHLKPGVKFTDGTPLNAQAVVDNFDYWTNPKTGNGDRQLPTSCPTSSPRTAVNDLTVQVKLNEALRAAA